MILKTRHFGEIEVDESSILEFKWGLPGFENVKKYILLDGKEEESPFRWLQSVDVPTLAFVIINPFNIKSDYDIELKNETIALLGIEKEEDVEVYSIVVVPDDMSKISMNLKAPVIINRKNKRGIQVVLDTDKYSVRHYILEELRRQEVVNNAGSDKEEGTVDSNK